MADSESLSDDYVASLLAKDAKESVIKYSAMGMEAFLPSKAPVSKPKPNTRFLRAIIKETDSHNAALLAKEAAESKARLQNLVTKEVRSGADIRRRQLGHITAHLTGSSTKRRRGEDEDTRSSDGKRKRNVEDENTQDKESSRRKLDEDDDRKRTRSSREDGHSHHRSHRRHRSRSEERSSRSDRHMNGSSRQRSPSSEEHRRTKSGRNHRSSEQRTSHRAEHDPDEDEKRLRPNRRLPEADTQKERKREKKNQSKGSPLPASDEDSDPLDEIIGPRPPPKVRSRGRGLTSAASGIDARFSSNYDPSVDIQLDLDEENDWDQALEAFRDRQKWRQQGADRLRAAGFTEEEIEKWKKGGEKRESGVKWAKKGESREWDKGKVFMDDEDGDVVKGVNVNYGRLKGT